MSQEAALPPSSMRLLRILRKEATDGYTLMSQLGGNLRVFAEALAPLIKREFVSITGDPYSEKGLATAFYHVPLPHRGEVDALLRDDLRSKPPKFPSPGWK